MKAKEIARQLLEARESDKAIEIVCDLINEAVALAKTRKQEASRLAVFRESFQKWRAVCALVAGGTPGEKDGVALYPKALQTMSKELFVACMQGGAFLSYEPDDEDRAVCEGVMRKIHDKEVEELARARFNVLFGHMMQRVFR